MLYSCFSTLLCCVISAVVYEVTLPPGHPVTLSMILLANCQLESLWRGFASSNPSSTSLPAASSIPTQALGERGVASGHPVVAHGLSYGALVAAQYGQLLCARECRIQQVTLQQRGVLKQ